jgi:GNAT superfamily N-acetyltransferase
MTPIFREATRDDVPAIIAMLADDTLGAAREQTDMTPYLTAFDDISAEGGNEIIIGTDAQGRIIATYQITYISGLSLAAARRALIESVRVASDLRGQGVGHKMFADIETRARATNCRLIQLTMNASRTDSQRFYESIGFTPSHIGFKRYLD